MMATTHALAGVALAMTTLLFAPDYAPVAVAAAAAGGFFPDLDLCGAHRRHLHYPVYYTVLTVPAVALALLAPAAATVAVAAFIAAAALHCCTDVLGAGLEREPWRGESDRAVYDHARGRWLLPRRWIPYDGAPEDLALAAVLAVPSLYAFGGLVESFVAVALAISIGYTLIRKRLLDVWVGILASLPADVRRLIPDQFHER